MQKAAKIKILLSALFALCLLFSACAEKSANIAYESEHTHVFGHWYVVREETCSSVGERVRYCKICYAAETDAIAIPEDEDARRHDFADAIVAPTESAEGYTERTCRLCGYHIERTDVKPPLYTIFADDNTALSPPAGYALSSICFYEVDTHRARVLSGENEAVAFQFARRLATAKVVSDAVRAGICAENSVLAIDEDFLAALPAGTTVDTDIFYEGAEVSVTQALECFLRRGGGDAAAALARFLSVDEAELAALSTARAEAFALTNTCFVSLVGNEAQNTTTIKDTAALLNAALADDMLAPLLSVVFSTSVRIAGHTPRVWFSTSEMRVSLVTNAEGKGFVLIIAGEDLPNLSAENAIFADATG